jgi:DNA-binding MarR family transcriptional regulator
MVKRSLRARRTRGVQADTHSAVASIRRLIRVLRIAAQQTHVKTGVSAAQLFVLQQLGEAADLSLSELAQRTLTDRSSVAAVVDRLQAAGLVARSVDTRDRRRAAVRITSAGRRVLARGVDAPATALVKALRRLDAKRLAALALSLEDLVAALGATHERAI